MKLSKVIFGVIIFLFIGAMSFEIRKGVLDFFRPADHFGYAPHISWAVDLLFFSVLAYIAFKLGRDFSLDYLSFIKQPSSTRENKKGELKIKRFGKLTYIFFPEEEQEENLASSNLPRKALVIKNKTSSEQPSHNYLEKSLANSSSLITGIFLLVSLKHLLFNHQDFFISAQEALFWVDTILILIVAFFFLTIADVKYERDVLGYNGTKTIDGIVCTHNKSKGYSLLVPEHEYDSSTKEKADEIWNKYNERKSNVK